MNPHFYTITTETGQFKQVIPDYPETARMWKTRAGTRTAVAHSSARSESEAMAAHSIQA